MITLDKKGRLAKYAYPTKYSTPPVNTSVCRLFWRIIFMTLFGYPSLGVLWGVLYLFVLPAGFFSGFFVAKRPPIFKTDATTTGWVTYTHWPRIGGRAVWPAIFIPFVLVALMLRTDPEGTLQTGRDLGQCLRSGLYPTVLLVVTTLLVFYFTHGFKVVRKSEWWTVFEAYVKSRKEKVCPLVRFVDPTEQGQSAENL